MIVVRQCQRFSSCYRHHHRHFSSLDGRVATAISSIFPLTYIRLSSTSASPPTLARSTHHLRHHLPITFFARPTYETFQADHEKRSAPFIAPRLSRDRLPSECRSPGKKLGVPSPELSRGAPLVDSAERRTSPTVCEKARARFPRYSSCVSASCPSSSRVDERKERGETRDALCVQPSRCWAVEDPQTREREKERE